MNQFLLFLNVAAAIVIFVHCVCRLSTRRWYWIQAELWAHIVLCGGAVGVMAHGLVQGGTHHPSEIIVNCGIAAYFLSQTWRQWNLNRFR